MVAPRSAHSPRSTVGALLLGLALALGAIGCSGEEAIPIDPANPPVPSVDLTDVTHRIEPTEEMRQAAAQQCLDDPALAEGYVRAVDPDTEDVVAELSVDCEEVRAGE